MKTSQYGHCHNTYPAPKGWLLQYMLHSFFFWIRSKKCTVWVPVLMVYFDMSILRFHGIDISKYNISYQIILLTHWRRVFVARTSVQSLFFMTKQPLALARKYFFEHMFPQYYMHSDAWSSVKYSTTH